MNKIKLLLGVILLSLGAMGLYATTTLPSIPFSAEYDAFQVVLIEIKRNRLITSAFILISGIVLILDYKKN